MNKIVKNAFILTAITVIAGLLLGVVYGVTKEPIANASRKHSNRFCPMQILLKL